MTSFPFHSIQLVLIHFLTSSNYPFWKLNFHTPFAFAIRYNSSVKILVLYAYPTFARWPLLHFLNYRRRYATIHTFYSKKEQQSDGKNVVIIILFIWMKENTECIQNIELWSVCAHECPCWWYSVVSYASVSSQLPTYFLRRLEKSNNEKKKWKWNEKRLLNSFLRALWGWRMLGMLYARKMIVEDNVDSLLLYTLQTVAFNCMHIV